MNIVSGSISLWYTFRNTRSGGTLETDSYKGSNSKSTTASIVGIGTSTGHHFGTTALASLEDSSSNNSDTALLASNESNSYIKRLLGWKSRSLKEHKIEKRESIRPILKSFEFVCLSLVLILSFIMILLFGLTLVTCKSPNVQCYSQFNFRIINGSNVSKSILTAINDVIKMAVFLTSEYNEDVQPGTTRKLEFDGRRYYNGKYSFFHNDDNSPRTTSPLLLTNAASFPSLYSPISNEKKSVSAEDIGTFSVDNLFELGFTGFCRYNISSYSSLYINSSISMIENPATKKYCVGDILNGIDLFSTLIRDFGGELAKSASGIAFDTTKDADSKNEAFDTSKTLGDALVLGYEASLPSIARFSMPLLNSRLKDEQKKTDYSLMNIKYAILIKNLSKLVPCAVCFGVMLSFAIILQNVKTISISKVSSRMKRKIVNCIFGFSSKSTAKKFLFILSLINFLNNIVIITVLDIYIRKLHSILTTKIALALIVHGKGFYLLVGCLICSAMQFILTTVNIFIE